MGKSLQKLVLLPGMDGTGELFKGLLDAFSGTFEIQTVQYPRDKVLSFTGLASIVQSATPAIEPFVLIAESFSTPLAIQFAASNPPNLKGIVLCAGFATSPARGWARIIGLLLAPLLFYLPPPRSAFKLYLVGPAAPESLQSAVRTAVASVKPKVLSARFRTVLACDARADLAKVTLPILYLQAGQDRLVKPDSLEEIRRIKPEIEAATIGGPHLLLQREPNQAAEVITRFVEQLG